MVDDLDLLLLVEVLDSEFMSDHVHDLDFHCSVEGSMAFGFDGLSFVYASSLVDSVYVDDMSDEVVSNDASVSSFNVVLSEDVHDVLVDLASLKVLGSLHVAVEMVEYSDKLLTVKSGLQVVVSLLDDSFSQHVLDGSVDLSGGPFTSVGNSSLEFLP